jgi:hypothetical protein
VDDNNLFLSPNYQSGWISGNCVDNVCSWTGSITIGAWYWRVQARDNNHIECISNSTIDSFIISLQPPSAPTLIDEPDVVSAVALSVTLQWNSVTCPDGHSPQYYVDVDDASDFSSINYTSNWIAGSCVSGVCNWSVTVDPDKTWHWRVKARDSYFFHTSYVSEWSTSDLFSVLPHNPPAAPTPWAEPDIVTSVPTDVTLQWWSVTSPDGDPVEYYVEVDDDLNFSSPDSNSDWISGNCVSNVCSWTVTSLPPGYWCWRVKARDNAHNLSIVSSWSTADCFNTRELPLAPVLIDEPNTVSLGQVAVELQWNPVTCPDGDSAEYFVQVDDSYLFLSPNYTSVVWISGDCVDNVCSWEVTVDPAITRTWYWRVQARDSVHTQAVSPWPTYDTFVVMSSNPPSVPELIHQPDVRTTVSVPVTFSWKASTDPDGDPVEYFVQVDDATNFILPNYTSVTWISGNCVDNVCSWTVTVNPGIRWYWRVQARDVAPHTDAVSVWSLVESFNTFSADPPSAPTLIHPPDGKVNTPLILEWNSVPCPDGDPVQYYVEVSWLLDPFIVYTSSGWISGTNWSVTLPTARTWYWRVRAGDVVHTDAVSPWSTDSFIIYGPPSAPTLTDEPDTVSSGPLSVTLNWDAVTCPDGDSAEYYVEVDDDPNFGSPDPTSVVWIPGTSLTVNLPTATTWYWRVQARNAIHTDLRSSWSTDSFVIYTPFIDESFEGTGYEEFSTGTVGSGCTLNPDATIPGTPPAGAGSQCLKSISAASGYQAYALRNYGSEQTKTFTSFYLYVEAEGLNDGNSKVIGVLQDNSSNSVFILRLNQNTGQLRFNLRIYNNTAWNDYYYNISLNTWYKIDIKYDDTTNTWQWRVNGISQTSGTLTGTHYTGIRTWNFGFGSAGQLFTGTIYYDLIRVNTLTFY